VLQCNHLVANLTQVPGLRSTTAPTFVASNSPSVAYVPLILSPGDLSLGLSIQPKAF
jgi:hypothetical protein